MTSDISGDRDVNLINEKRHDVLSGHDLISQFEALTTQLSRGEFNLNHRAQNHLTVMYFSSQPDFHTITFHITPKYTYKQ